MLNQLIESREHYQESARRGKFLFTTLTAAILFCASGLVWSLFAKDLAVGGEEFDLARLVTPVVETAAEPPLIEEVRQTARPQNSSLKENSIPVRKVIMAATNESRFVPKEISNAPVSQQSRPSGAVILGTIDSGPTTADLQGVMRESDTGKSGGKLSDHGIKTKLLTDEGDKDDPPTMKRSASPAQDSKSKAPISIGVVNGRAISLPKPPYTAAAQAIRAGGDVKVEVVIDESGRVTSARAIGGHPILRGICETAARSAKFEPTYLSKVPVKVSGVIVYKFSLNE